MQTRTDQMSRAGSGNSGSAFMNRAWIQTAVYTSFALTCFAANSILCRLALGERAIDAAGFTFIRLVSGALMLLGVTATIEGGGVLKQRGSWPSAVMLFLYAITFSFAYVSLSAGTGALILFGSVQATMILAGLHEGERFRWSQWAGLLIALFGLVYLVLPGWQAPSLSGAALMSVAGISWGIYSLRGRGADNPIGNTSGNFIRTVPLVLVVLALHLSLSSGFDVSLKGAVVACLSGALTSGIGYVIWYVALRGLSATLAATVQLCVPVLAAFGGVMFLSEQITSRLIFSSVLIIGGVGSILFVRSR
jgi:drug/metabolite transporter (DMT)-like permease